MKTYKLVIVLIFFGLETFGQESHYFDPYFTARQEQSSPHVREYDDLDTVFVVMDYKNDILVSIGNFFGFQTSEEIDLFIYLHTNYLVEEMSPGSFLENSRAEVISRYDGGGKKSFSNWQKGEIKYGKVWDQAGKNILLNGSGELITSENNSSKRIQLFNDHKLVEDFEVRYKESDTIYSMVDEPPIPLTGFPAFYKILSKKLKKFHSTLGRFGRVYIELTLNEQGQIIECSSAQVSDSFIMEKLLAKLQDTGKWHPGKVRNETVKVKCLLPITFIP